jgi:hypothetical protein
MVTKTIEEMAALTPEEKVAHFAAEENTVFGDDHKKRDGLPIEQGIGSPGHESINHYRSIRRSEGEEAYAKAVAELKRRDPDRFKRLGL